MSLFDDVGQTELGTREREAWACKLPLAQKRAKLVEMNSRYILTVAKNFGRRYPHIPLTALFSEASQGALDAAKDFDSERGTKFISYAKRRILWALQDAARNWNRVVYHPRNVLESWDGTPAPPAETSVDSGPEDGDLLDLISEEVESPPTPEEIANDKARAEDFVAAIERRCTAKEGAIIRMHYGLTGEGRMNFREIGAALTITRQAAQRNLKRGLRKLKNDPLILQHAADLFGSRPTPEED